jgi:hypothetical protein
MTATLNDRNRTSTLDLQRVIEPLASIICAADRPKALLTAVYSALVQEVDLVHRAARAQAASFARPASRVEP